MNKRRLIVVAAVAGGLILVFSLMLGFIGMSGLASTDRVAGPLEGSGVGGPFALVDQDGRAVSEHRYDGKWRLMYFGYTFCPDICPTDVQKLAQGMKALDPATRAKVVPIFVTVDPARDTPAAVKTFVRAFSPTMVGLTGSPEQVKAALSAWKVYARKSGEGRDYLMDHSAMLYLMDPANQPVSFLAHDATPAAIAAEVKKYVS